MRRAAISSAVLLSLAAAPALAQTAEEQVQPTQEETGTTQEQTETAPDQATQEEAGATEDQATQESTDATQDLSDISLVTISLEDALKDIALELNISESDVPVTIQVPISIAANVCNVSINTLTEEVQQTGGDATCIAISSQTLTQVVQQQIEEGVPPGQQQVHPRLAAPGQRDAHPRDSAPGRAKQQEQQ